MEAQLLKDIDRLRKEMPILVDSFNAMRLLDEKQVCSLYRNPINSDWSTNFQIFENTHSVLEIVSIVVTKEAEIRVTVHNKHFSKYSRKRLNARNIYSSIEWSEWRDRNQILIRQEATLNLDQFHEFLFALDEFI